MSLVVDERCDIVGARVYKSYSCILNQTNIALNANKFYIMQIITNGVDYWIWCRYGRIGEKGVPNKSLYHEDWLAIKTFCSSFYKKTGNRWGVPFQKKPGKYIMADVEEPILVQEESIPDSRPLETKVDLLIRMISDRQLMTRTLQKLNVDTKRLPLGKITKEQLAKADEILFLIGTYIAPDFVSNLEIFDYPAPERFRKERLLELSSDFWTLVPYVSGKTRPPIINDHIVLSRCADQLFNIKSIDVSTKIIEKNITPAKIYETLEVDILPIDDETQEWKMLSDYVTRTQGATHKKISLLEAFSVDKGEKAFVDKQKIFDKTPNHLLLFHGSRSANFVGIFSEGLRIPTSTQITNGAVLGAGIYFADCVTKSFNYCHDDIGLVLVCEVALGESEIITRANSGPLPEGCQSRMACGRFKPREEENGQWFKNQGVMIPYGTLEQAEYEEEPGFYYNEYVIYLKEQYRFRYLLKLKNV